MAKSIIRRSCMTLTGSTLFCLSIQDKQFLKHSAASELETCFSSGPSSCSSLLSFSLECPVTMTKSCSSDICSVVGSTLSSLSQSSRGPFLESPGKLSGPVSHPVSPRKLFGCFSKLPLFSIPLFFPVNCPVIYGRS